MTVAGLDYAFLDYLQVSIEGEAALHGYYLPFLRDYQRVLDLGCGLGGFVKLLRDHGIDAYGVDSDPDCITAARRHNLPVVEADVLEHLRSLEPGSLDAIFSAHMVEHMPYEVVLTTIELAARALRPGGRLLIVTPNPRALITHLELYHMHFGHCALYHPKLLSFFMQRSGFAHTQQGENPHTMPAHISAESPLRLLTTPPPATFATWQEPLPKPASPLRQAIWYVKMGLIRWLVRPYVDRTQQELQQLRNQVSALTQTLHTTIDAVNRPFECYVIGDKAAQPEPHSPAK